MNLETEKLHNLISKINFPFTIIFDTKKTSKHWFLSYNYFFIREDYTIENIPFKTFYHVYSSSYHNEKSSLKDYMEKEVLNSIKQSWNLEFEIGRIEIFAWCSEIVEKDGSLFFLYDNLGNNRGIYCHSFVWENDVVFVAKNLTDYFDLEKAEIEIIEARSNFILPRIKLSKNKTQTFEELLIRDEFLILDAEFGCEPNLDFYKNFIDTTIIPLTRTELKYSNLALESDTNGILKFIWELDTVKVKFSLKKDTDYIDGKEFYKKLNEVLVLCSSTKLLVPFRHYNFGQEYGLAYLDSKKAKKLGELFNIELI